jgi:hypothetical protein
MDKSGPSRRLLLAGVYTVNKYFPRKPPQIVKHLRNAEDALKWSWTTG